MSDGRRFHRPEPERTAPRRHWTGLYRASDSWGRGADAPRSASEPLATIGGFVGDLLITGARLGTLVVGSLAAAAGGSRRSGTASPRDPSSRPGNPDRR